MIEYRPILGNGESLILGLSPTSKAPAVPFPSDI